MKYTQIIPVQERGILTSTYKQEIKNDVRIAKTRSLSQVKSLLTNHQGKIESQAGTILQVAFFAVVIIMITF